MNWTTKDGKKIPIVEMSNTHLSNAIRMMERAQAKFEEDERRAMDEADCGTDGTFSSGSQFIAEHPMLTALKQEAGRREFLEEERIMLSNSTFGMDDSIWK